jgi:hypothetical protein
VDMDVLFVRNILVNYALVYGAGHFNLGLRIKGYIKSCSWWEKQVRVIILTHVSNDFICGMLEFGHDIVLGMVTMNDEEDIENFVNAID